MNFLSYPMAGSHHFSFQNPIFSLNAHIPHTRGPLSKNLDYVNPARVIQAMKDIKFHC